MTREKKESIILIYLFGIVGVFLITSRNVNADYKFGPPENLGPLVNNSYVDAATWISSDELELYFTSDRPDGYGGYDMWMTSRASRDSVWDAPVNFGANINSPLHEGPAVLSPNGLELYFTVFNKSGGYGNGDIWVSTRSKISDSWGPVVNLGGIVNSPSDEVCRCISSDGLTLFFGDGYLINPRPGGEGDRDIWMTKRATITEPWDTPVNLGPPVNSPVRDFAPFISTNELLLFFTSPANRVAGNDKSDDIWMTKRESVLDLWSEPVNLGLLVNSVWVEAVPILTTTNTSLYFCSNRPGGFGQEDIWQIPILPIVDFNEDGIVDATDMCIMIDYWGTDEPLCDIVPTPFGDGVVDVEDLIVLAEHLFEEVPPTDPVE